MCQPVEKKPNLSSCPKFQSERVLQTGPLQSGTSLFLGVPAGLWSAGLTDLLGVEGRVIHTKTAKATAPIEPMQRCWFVQSTG